MRLLSLSVVGCLGAALHAQCVQQSSPPFAGAPLFFSMDGPTAPAATALGLFKCEGFTNVPPAPWSAAFAPEFNLDIAFRNLLTPSCSVGSTALLPDVDAVSIGMDWILSDTDGNVVVPANRWGAVSFTVSRNSRGRAGTPIRLEADQAEGAGTDVFTYALPGSVLPAHLLGVAKRLHDGPEMGLTRTPMTIDALDQFIPLYRTDAVIRGLITATPTLYFSVTNASLGRVPASWWSGTPPSGATILRTTWSTTARKWGCVTPWRIYGRIAGTNFSHLGLTQCEDVDGLALDLPRGHMLFSTTAGGCVAQPDQIMYLNLATDGDPTPVPYVTQTGTAVSIAAGLLGSDDVKAICSTDPIAPFRQATGGPPNVSRMTMGTPSTVLTFPGIARRMDATSFMACWPGAGPARIVSYGLGWPRGPAAGAAAAYLTVPGSGLPPTFLAVFARNPAATFCGDPLPPWTLDLPPALRLLTPAVRFEVTWVGLDTVNMLLAQAFPVGIDM